MSCPTETPVYINCVNSPAEIWSEAISLDKKLLISRSSASFPPAALLICKATLWGRRRGVSPFLPRFPQRSASLRRSISGIARILMFLCLSFFSGIPCFMPLLFASWMLESTRDIELPFSVLCGGLTTLIWMVLSCIVNVGSSCHGVIFHSCMAGELGEQVLPVKGSTFREEENSRTENGDLRGKN